MNGSTIENGYHINRLTSTYDHRTLKIELPVRSAVLKQCTGGLVVRWVTTGEYPLLQLERHNPESMLHGVVVLFLDMSWYPSGDTRAERCRRLTMLNLDHASRN
jgi:hypothetical protein